MNSKKKWLFGLAISAFDCHILENILIFIVLSMTFPMYVYREDLSMIEVTESASKAIKAFMDERTLESALRVYMQSGG